MQKSLFKDLIPCLKALKHLSVPSNNLGSPVVPEITQCLASNVGASLGQQGQLETLNIGNNLFAPSELLSLSRIALTSGSLPKLKKLVIAFSDLGEGAEYVGGSLCQLLKESTAGRLEELDVRCCGLKLSEMQVLRQALILNKNLKIRQINAGLNQFNQEQLRGLIKEEANVAKTAERPAEQNLSEYTR